MEKNTIIGCILGSAWIAFFAAVSLFQPEWGQLRGDPATGVQAQERASNTTDSSAESSPPNTVPVSVLRIETGYGQLEATEYQYKKDEPTDWGTLFSGISTLLVLATLIYLRSQIEHAKAAVATMRGAERPWLVMGDFSLHGLVQDPKETFLGLVMPYLQYEWQNVGRSPAFIVGMNAHLSAIDFNETVAKPWAMRSEPPDSSGVVGPGGSDKSSAHFHGRTISYALRESLLESSDLLVFQAFVKYRDVFGELYETRHCIAIYVRFGTETYKHVGGPEYNLAT